MTFELTSDTRSINWLCVKSMLIMPLLPRTFTLKSFTDGFVFGTIQLSAGDQDARVQRLRRSVLDSVVDQYKYFTGSRSPLGTASKSRVKDHLDRIREFEQRAYEMREKDPDAPGLPTRLS